MHVMPRRAGNIVLAPGHSTSESKIQIGAQNMRMPVRRPVTGGGAAGLMVGKKEQFAE